MLFFRCCPGASITFSVWPPARRSPHVLCPCVVLFPPAAPSRPPGFFWHARVLLLAGVGSGRPGGRSRVSAARGTVEPRPVRDSRDRSVWGLGRRRHTGRPALSPAGGWRRGVGVSCGAAGSGAGWRAGAALCPLSGCLIGQCELADLGPGWSQCGDHSPGLLAERTVGLSKPWW